MTEFVHHLVCHLLIVDDNMKIITYVEDPLAWKLIHCLETLV